MRHIRTLIRVGEMTPVTRLVAGLICLLLVFAIVYPIFLFIGKIGGADLTSLGNAAADIKYDTWSMKYLQAAQHISLFIIPMLVWSWISEGNVYSYSGLKRWPPVDQILLVMLISFLLFPVNGFLAFLNHELNLPEWLSGFETWIFEREETAKKITIALMEDGNISVLITNLAVLAIIPALGEELFFRGFIQRNLTGILGSANLSVVLSAIIFSALHFQFLGFVPRFILGLIYGYLFMWSQSIWLPVLAHFLNNAVPVMLSWFYGWNVIDNASTEIVSENPAFPLFAAGLLVITLIYSRRVILAPVNG